MCVGFSVISLVICYRMHNKCMDLYSKIPMGTIIHCNHNPSLYSVNYEFVWEPRPVHWWNTSTGDIFFRDFLGNWSIYKRFDTWEIK